MAINEDQRAWSRANYVRVYYSDAYGPHPNEPYISASNFDTNMSIDEPVGNRSLAQAIEDAVSYVMTSPP
jgi:hypothetical protein